MNDAVNDIEETTSMETSQVSDEKTTDEDFSEEDFSSSEDVNTQSDEEEDEAVTEALDEVKSPRGENRVQALANDKKRLAEDRERLAEENNSLRQEMEAIRRQGAAYTQPPQSNEEYLARQVQQTHQLIESTRQEIDWNEAARTYPELDESSDKYDREFDDKVYAEYLVRKSKDPSVTPKQVAQGFKSYIDRITTKAASRAEGVRELKRSVSTTGSSRTEPDASASDDYQKSRNKWDKSGSIDDLADVLKHV